eukprot:403358509
MSEPCSQCSKSFNLTNKRPIGLEKCLCTWCLDCINHKLKDNPMREVYCPEDEEVSTMPAVLRENKQILRKIQPLDQLNIFCDDHEGQTATQYCNTCQIPVCPHCKRDAHNEHFLIDLKQSNFKIYTSNVVRMLDEYSVENIKSELVSFSKAERKLQSSEFKNMINKVNRMFCHIVSEEEYQKIDFASSMEDPLNNPQNRQIQQKFKIVEEEKSQSSLNLQTVQQLIDEQHSQLRQEYKQALSEFEFKQKEINNKNNDSIKLTRGIQDQYNKKLDEFKRALQSGCNSKYEQFNQTLIHGQKEVQNITKYGQEQYAAYQLQLQLILGQFAEFQAQLSNFTIKFQKIDKYDALMKNQKAQIDTLQQKIQEVNGNSSGNSEVQQLQEIDVKVSQHLLSNISILNEKINELTKRSNGQKDDDIQLMTYQQYGKEIMKSQFRLLVDVETLKKSSSILQKHISNYSTKQYKLLYKGTRDGFYASSFHQQCDNQGPTVCFIQSEYGQVFGGYTSIPWKKTDDWIKHKDDTAFVFSLSKRSIHKQFKNKNSAVQHWKGLFCYFGENGDICLNHNCDKETVSWCHLGSTYNLPNGYDYNTDEGNSYLGGYHQFKVLDIEVYSFK